MGKLFRMGGFAETGIVGIQNGMGFRALKIGGQTGTAARQEQGQNGNDKIKFVSACHGLLSLLAFIRL